MYDGIKGLFYWFWLGINWVGVFVWICGMVMGLFGLVGVFNLGFVSVVVVNMYKMGWLLLFFIVGFVYYFFCLFIKVCIYFVVYEGMFMIWEYMVKEKCEGFYDGECESGLDVIMSCSFDIEIVDDKVVVEMKLFISVIVV